MCMLMLLFLLNNFVTKRIENIFYIYYSLRYRTKK